MNCDDRGGREAAGADGLGLAEKTVRENIIYRGKIITLRVDDALLPDGKPCKREMVMHPGGACVLFVRDKKVLLVRQFRYAYGEITWEVPAGKLNPGEDPKDTASRELEEETGWTPERTELLYTIYPTPGYTNEKIYIYQAHGVREGHVHPDEDEFVDCAFFPLEEAEKMIESGAIRDAKTIIAMQHYLLKAQK